MAGKLMNLGFGNSVAARRVVAILSPASAPMKRLREEARQAGRLLDATQGRRTRSIIVTDSGHVLLSAIQPDTMAQRYEATSFDDVSLELTAGDEP
jgi:extracellular matrix regulatory protein A